MNYFTKHKDRFIELLSLFIKCLLFYIASIVFLESFLFVMYLILTADAYNSFRMFVNMFEFFLTAVFIIMTPISFFFLVFNLKF
mgnify:FL=1